MIVIKNLAWQDLPQGPLEGVPIRALAEALNARLGDSQMNFAPIACHGAYREDLLVALGQVCVDQDSGAIICRTYPLEGGVCGLIPMAESLKIALERSALLSLQGWLEAEVGRKDLLGEGDLGHLKRLLKRSRVGLYECIAQTLTLEQTHDAGLLSCLNRRVQDLHYQGNAQIFKPHQEEAMAEFFRNILGAGSGAIAYVASIDGCAAGYILLTYLNYQDHAFRHAYKALVVDQISVETWADGFSIGTELLGLAETVATHEGITRIEMNHWAFNPHSGDFFRAKGYHTYNIRMAKDLKA